jgi:hypothetical protein
MKAGSIFRSYAAALGAVLVSAPATAQSCDQLWLERNAIFKEAGYCFKTPRAIRRFGNAGCQYDSEYDVPLSARQRQTVNGIKRAEQQYGCP